MKRILVWGMTENWGGIESVLYNYVINSDTTKIKFDFITTFTTIPHSNELKAAGSQIIILPDRRNNYFSYKNKLHCFMKEYAKFYDAVWLNDCMFGNIDILKFAKKYKIQKRIVHAHNANNLGGGISRLIRHKINSLLLPFYATDYWACSKLAGEWTYNKKIISSNKYKIINNAIDSKLYKYDPEIRCQKRKEFGVDCNTQVLGHIGRFDYQKNHPYLLKVFSEYTKNHPNSILICIGTGTDLETIKNLSVKMGLKEKVLFLGQRSDVTELLQAFDIFLFPSQFEGLPVVIIEALAAGLPCFISDRVTRESAIIPELSEYLSIGDNPTKWVEAIDKKIHHIKRADTQQLIIDAGFDIQEQVHNLLNLF